MALHFVLFKGILMKKLITCCVAGLIAISASATYAQTVVYQHTFDGVANDSTPALQILSNGVGDPPPMTDLSTGEIANIFNSASGFNTTAGIDLSDMNEFTIEFVVTCLLYTSPSPRDATLSRMPSSA